ncbi:hypothetical protein [Sorangium cellulosum]|uniref:Lipoprotein n=1 Tax=Sorangium cellulosum So0157-2 TaxID=1254432 RepID=S4Y493_SORCE|nr:hypothetical protein [Sorangium cellulosum]AGP40242.1 hypothetical protein SCE1572_40495 [Sorangium cellulosum So0157-2]
MRGPLARSALAAPVLAALALGAPSARADGPLAAGPAGPFAGPRPVAGPTGPLADPAGGIFAGPAAGDPLARLPGGLPRVTFPERPLARAYAPLRDPDPWFSDDKARHFCASIALASGGYALGALATDDLHGRIAVGAAVALGAGLAKEAFDAAGYGTPSLRDLVWDALGTSAGLALSVWFDLGATPVAF